MSQNKLLRYTSYFFSCLLLTATGFIFTTCETSQPEYQSRTSPTEEYCISEDEEELYRLINQYRRDNDLKKIRLSSSLSEVAGKHARDLSLNDPAQGECNAHSWSDKGEWNGCCYTSDHNNSECMWNKPEEITGYPGDGYEIVGTRFNSNTGEQVDIIPEKALEGWRKSIPHNRVILNQGIWKQQEWEAIGVGIHRGFATVWFGSETDPAGEAEICN